jgi:predicted N-acyltransferase
MPQTKGELNYSITDTINDIPKDDWDRLFGKDTIEGWGFHKTIEESGMQEFSYAYLLVHRNLALVAIIPFFINDFSFTTIIQGPLQKLILSIQKVYRRFLRSKIIFVGNPLAEKLYIGVSVEEDLREIVTGALKKIHCVAKDEGIAALIFYNLTVKDKLLAECLKINGLSGMENFPNTILEIREKSLEEFINSRGHSTRKDLRRKLRKANSLALLRTEVLDDISGLKDGISRLYFENFQDSEVHFEILNPEFFLNISKYMPGVAKFFVTYADDKIVAFNLCLVSADFFIDKVIGMDSKVSHVYNLYYTTFCHNIDWCIKNKVRYYVIGITDYHPKIRLGAKLVPLYIYLKVFNPLLRLFLRPLVGFIEPKNFDPVLKNLHKSKKTEIISGEKFL